MQSATQPAVDPGSSLVRLGFTPMEAMVYRHLLQNPGDTGYRVAIAIHKSQAHTYSALSSLAAKGAVLRSGEKSGEYSPVPVAELIRGLRSQMTEHLDAVEEEFSRLATPAATGEVMRLENREQVLERARTMLNGARGTVVYHMFPMAMRVLREPLEAACARLGQACAGLVLTPEDAEAKVNAHLVRNASLLLQVYPADQVSIVVDGMQVLIAHFDRENGNVVRAVWTDDPLIAHLVHNGLVSDTLVHKSGMMDAENASPNRLLLGRLPPSFAETLRTRAAPTAE